MKITLPIGVDPGELDRSNDSIASQSTDQRPRRFSGDRGATLVEAAIYTPVLMLFLFGILEFGLAFRSYLTAAHGTRDASRSASIMGTSPDADFHILRDIKSSMVAIPPSSIDRIVIWHASGPGDSVPAGCAAGSATSVGRACNVYTGADLTRGEDDFGCAPSSPDRYWCPTSRNTALNDPPDFVGIYIEVRHNFVSGLFGAGLDMADTTIMRLEPEGLS